MQEHFNLRCFIQHLIDQSGYDYDDYYYLDNPLSEHNWILQTNWIFVKYFIHNGCSMTTEQLNKNSVRPIIKVIPHQKLDTDEGEYPKDEGESPTSTELSEDSISDIPTGSTEHLKPSIVPHVPTISISSNQNDADSSRNKLIPEFEQTQENGEQNIRKDHKLLSTNLTVEIENRKFEGLLTYSLDQQIFKFKVTNGVEESQGTSNSDKWTNLESWAVYVDFKSYDQKWTIDGILQTEFLSSNRESKCYIRENLKTNSCEYIAIKMIYILHQQHLKKFSIFYKTNTRSIFIYKENIDQ